MLFYLAWKNILSRKSSVVIIVFITFALCLMTVINSLFDSTEHGVQTVYTQSFTGDVVIRPENKLPLSLFGDETPITGDLSTIPTLIPYSDIYRYIQSYPTVSQVIPQVTSAVVMECNDNRTATYVFGVPGTSYVEAMPSIRIVEGAPYSDMDRGVMLSTGAASSIGASVGDTIQFITQDGISARIRAATLTAVYEYAVENSILDNIALADPYTVRSLLGLAETADQTALEISQEKTDLLDEDYDLEDLFGDAEDSDAFVLDDDFPNDVGAWDDLNVTAASTTWNYLIIRCNDSTDSSLTIRKLNSYFKKQGWPVEAMNWRNAAGSTALYLYWMRLIFNIGVLVILVSGFIIINNTLIVGVLNRTQEIGTLRAEGASRLFISVQCMIETFLLTISAGILACILGAGMSAFVSGLHITFTNSFLIQLFGSETLSFSTAFPTMAETLELSVLLGMFGWVYPVRTALKVTPVQAMQGGS